MAMVCWKSRDMQYRRYSRHSSLASKHPTPLGWHVEGNLEGFMNGHVLIDVEQETPACATFLPHATMRLRRARC